MTQFEEFHIGLKDIVTRLKGIVPDSTSSHRSISSIRQIKFRAILELDETTH